jgi:purine-binding chemotaxis protein CheW
MEPSATSQYLTFILSDQSFGIDILKVQEIRGYTGVTPIPNTPPQVKGVVNLRGIVIPVVDLRVKFATGACHYDKFTVVVVVTVGHKTVGLVVDAVSDVMDVSAETVHPVPELGAHVDTRYISGMATSGDNLTVLLDIEQLLSGEELLDEAA